MQRVSVDVKADKLARGQYKGAVLEDGPRERQRRAHLEHVALEEQRVSHADGGLKGQTNKDVEQGQPQHLCQLARIPGGQRAAPAVLEALGETGHADVE